LSMIAELTMLNADIEALKAGLWQVRLALAEPTSKDRADYFVWKDGDFKIEPPPEERGGPGSGNWGHAGNPPFVGGSKPTGGGLRPSNWQKGGAGGKPSEKAAGHFKGEFPTAAGAAGNPREFGDFDADKAESWGNSVSKEWLGGLTDLEGDGIGTFIVFSYQQINRAVRGLSKNEDGTGGPATLTKEQGKASSGDGYCLSQGGNSRGCSNLARRLGSRVPGSA
jgi:hypothetical protein